MIRAAAILLLLLIAGNAIAEVSGLPIPGAALGLVMLTAIFVATGGPDEELAEMFDFAAPYFPMFFVPAAVGVMNSGEMLSLAWLHVAAAIVLGTAVTLVATGLVVQALMGRMSRDVTP
jgi:holin-like protein